jgi:hypothetical protein
MIATNAPVITMTTGALFGVRHPTNTQPRAAFRRSERHTERLVEG